MDDTVEVIIMIYLTIKSQGISSKIKSILT